MSLPSSLPGVGSPHGGRESQTSDRDGVAIIMSVRSGGTWFWICRISTLSVGKGLGYLVYFVQEMQDYWHLVPWENEVERKSRNSLNI